MSEDHQPDTVVSKLRDHYQVLYHDSPDAHLLMALEDGTFFECNKAAEVMLRGTRERILGMTPDQVSPEYQPDGRTTLDCVPEMIRASVENGYHRFEWVHRRLDGEKFWAEVTISPTIVDGRQALFIAWRDISDRKRTEQENKELKDHYQVLFHDSPDAHLLMALEGGTIVECNKAAEVMLRGTREQILGLTPDQISPEFQPDGRTSLESVLENISISLDKGYHRFEWVHRRLDGENFWAEVTISPTTVDGHQVLFVAWRDISDWKQTEQALENAKESAEAASRAKSAFLANMSHELRTPMNHIMGMTMLAIRRATDPKQRDQLAKVDAASQHLLSLINDILDLSKIEAQRLVIEHLDFNLSAVVDNLTNLLGHRAAEKGLAFHMDVPGRLLTLPLRGDPLRLGQILINFVSNAVKFTENGQVGIRIRVVEETPVGMLLRFEVEDTGIGISVEEQKRLFKDFEQADNSITRKYGGTGLGLAINRRLVQMMGGEIGVDSDPGKGSTFWFTARLDRGGAITPEKIAAKEMSAEEQLLARHGNARILVVEDEPVNMAVAQNLLEMVGMQSDVAIEGYEAVVLAQEFRYDLILMDVQMPILNGIDATRIIRIDSLNVDTPIVAMTANAFEEDKHACLEAGMNDHVSKPVVPVRLYEVILHWLDQQTTNDADGRPIKMARQIRNMNFDDVIAAHIRWKAHLHRFVEGSSDEQLDSVTVCNDGLCDLGLWIYGEGAEYESVPAYQDLLQKHAQFHMCAGSVVKKIEDNDRSGAKAILGGPFTEASKLTVAAIMELKRTVTQG